MLGAYCTDYGDKKGIRICQTGCRFTTAKADLNGQQWKRKPIVTVSWHSPVFFFLYLHVEWLQYVGTDLNS